MRSAKLQLVHREGCDAGEKCSYAIRGDGVLVGSCTALNGQGNPDGTCVQISRLAAITAAKALFVSVLRAVSESVACSVTGVSTKPRVRAPRHERLQTTSGVVRGYGLCVTNQ